MAFNGFQVSRFNIYNRKREDMPTVWNTKNWLLQVEKLINQNVRGDLICVYECETEDSPYLIHSYFNDPYSGWIHEQNGIPIEHEMATFEQYAY